MRKSFILLDLSIIGECLKTYVEVFISAEGEKASIITQKLHDLDLGPAFGQHDFVYNWKDDVTLPEVLRLVDNIQSKLKGTGTILKFTTIR